MKYIKLVASDLDGTLLDKNKEITPRLYHALEQMNEQGIYFVPATGRPFSTVPQAIKALPFLRYVITSNGAAIYDAVEKKAVIENNLSPNAVDAVIPIAKRLPVITEYFIHGKAYIAKSVYENLSPYGLTESHVRYILNSRTPVENFWEKMQKSHAILENINLIFRDMDLRKQVSVFAPLPHLHRKILKSPLPLPPRRRHWKRFVPCLASKRSMCLPWETAITICPCWNLRALALPWQTARHTSRLRRI